MLRRGPSRTCTCALRLRKKRVESGYGKEIAKMRVIKIIGFNVGFEIILLFFKQLILDFPDFLVGGRCSWGCPADILV